MSGKDTGQNALPDDRETGMSIEPLIPEEGSRYRPGLDRLAAELIEKSRALSDALPEPHHAPLASLMRVIECHYSNRIEGDVFSPLAIERASVDRSSAPTLRFPVNHIRTQEWLDHGGLRADPLSPDGLCAIHEKLCDGLHETQLIQTSRGGGHERIVPGRFRQGYVQVGRHIAPSPGSVPRLLRHLNLMRRFQSPLGRIVWAATSHHRLVWIHPFPDHNGRTSRLVARAMLSESLTAPPLWSLSRGLWRAIDDYRKSLSAADTPRQGGADGRGALSEELAQLHRRSRGNNRFDRAPSA